MSQQGTLPPRRTKKFLFDVHNFDVEADDDDIETFEEEAEPPPPPPPTFSVEEMEAAKAAAYERGHMDGRTEALGEIEQQIADTLGAIRGYFNILFDAEERRDSTFEKESVQLAHSIFAKAFPALNAQYGLPEVERATRDILEKLREQPEILIDVGPAYVDHIQRYADGLFPRGDGPKCTVRSNPALGAGQCQMTWPNGSALRDGPRTAGQIQEKIEHLLADKAILTDNEETNSLPPPSGAETDHGEPHDG